MMIVIDIVPETTRVPELTVVKLQFGRAVGVIVTVAVAVAGKVAVGDRVGVAVGAVGVMVGVLLGVAVPSSTSTVAVSLLVR